MGRLGKIALRGLFHPPFVLLLVSGVFSFASAETTLNQSHTTVRVAENDTVKKKTVKKKAVKKKTVKKKTVKKKTVKKKTVKKKTVKKRTVKKKTTHRRRKKQKRAVEIPIDIGIGPAVHQFTGSIQQQQTYHTGIKLSLAAIIDQSVIASQKHRIPKKYRGLANKTKTIRLRPGPLVLMPDTIIISPPQEDTGMYGANWRFLGVGLPLLNIIDLGTGLNLSYVYLTGSETNPKTHFFRPGLDFTANVEIPLSRSFLVSVGWSSFLYPPQPVGGGVLSWGSLDESIWHVGQAYFRLHFRMPYTVYL